MLSSKEKVITIFRAYPNELITKEYLCNVLGIGDREVRKIISKLAFEIPIVSLSNQKGYFLATDETCIEDIEHQINDLNSRIKFLKERKKPLFKLWKKLNKLETNINRGE